MVYGKFNHNSRFRENRRLGRDQIAPDSLYLYNQETKVVPPRCERWCISTIGIV